MSDQPFQRRGGPIPASPVVISVPHAGRVYPPALYAALRLPAGALVALEDRFVDLVADAAWNGEAMFVQQHARAWIDLNRSEQERDPRVDEGAPTLPVSAQSAKLRSGLGLIPRRIAQGDLWRRRFSSAEVAARIDGDHRLYHAALADALAAAREAFGVAVLLDLHSMPPLPGGGARIVLGDRFGRSASARFVTRLEGVAAAHRRSAALNIPYAGGYILDRHGVPAAGIHAIQVELDRSLYLTPSLDRPGAGLADTGRLVRDMLAALADEALAGLLPMAAE